MIDRTSVERAAERFKAPEGALERLIRRRDRKRRNQRITAGVVGIAVFLAAVWIVRDVASLNRTLTPAIQPTERPTKSGPAYIGTTYTLGPVTEEDVAVGESFMQAWLDGDLETAAAMFTPEGTFDGFQPAVLALPALDDWFRAGGWTFGRDGRCGIHGWDDQRGVVGCGFTFENDLTRALGMEPISSSDTCVSLVVEAGRIETAWFGCGGDAFNMFGSPDPDRRDLFGAAWDMFIEWLSTNYPDDFERMYDAEFGRPILDPASIELWERYTDEFVASPQALRRSFTDWMASQSFDVQAGRICVSVTDRFWATVRADHLKGQAFDSTLADFSEERLAELRALPLQTEADRATMDAFIPLAEHETELFREGLGTLDLERRLDSLIPGCWFSLGG